MVSGLKKKVTYAVGLLPGVKGLVHLCYMLDHYHSAETLSKDISLRAPRPGRKWGDLWLVLRIMI